MEESTDIDPRFSMGRPQHRQMYSGPITRDHGPFTRYHGSIAKRVLMSDPSEVIRVRATWVLGMICFTTATLRDTCLQNGIVPSLLTLLKEEKQPISVEMTVWYMSNCCGLEPRPALDLVAPLAVAVAPLVGHSDQSVATEACLFFACFGQGSRDNRGWMVRRGWMACQDPQAIEDDLVRVTDNWERIQVVVDCGVVGGLVNRLSGERELVIAALKAVSHVVCGNVCQARAVVDAGGLDKLAELLLHGEERIRSDALWVISNICVSDESILDAVMKSGIIPRVAKILCPVNRMGVGVHDHNHLKPSPKADLEARRQALWVMFQFCHSMFQFCHSDNVDHIRHVVSSGGMKWLCFELIEFFDALDDPTDQCVLLCTIGLILDAGKKMGTADPYRFPYLINPYLKLFCEYDGCLLLRHAMSFRTGEMVRTKARQMDLQVNRSESSRPHDSFNPFEI